MKRSLKSLMAVLFVFVLSPASFASLVVDAGGPYGIYTGNDLYLQGTADGSVTSAGWTSPGNTNPFFTSLTGTVQWATLNTLNPPLYHNVPMTLTLTASDGTSIASDTATLTIWDRYPIPVLQTVPTPLGSLLTLDASQSFQYGPATLVRYGWDLNPVGTYSGQPGVWPGFQADFWTVSPVLTLTSQQYASFYSTPGTYYPAVQVFNSMGDMSYAQADLQILAPVPIPSTMLLLGSGLVGLVCVRRRSRR